MQQERHLEILRSPPKPLIDRMAVGSFGHGRNRDKGTDKTQFLAALELLAGLVDIVDVEHRDALEALRIGLAEIGDPVVVNAADFGQQLGVQLAVPKEALARLQAGTPHAVLFILGDHVMRVVGALADILPDAEEIDLRGVLEALPGLHHCTQGANLHAAKRPGVIFAAAWRRAPLHPWRAVAKFGLDAGRVHVRWLDNVRIRRNHFERNHLTVSSFAADGLYRSCQIAANPMPPLARTVAATRAGEGFGPRR